MPAPSPLAITTSSVQRLLKEEASYHKELADQEKTVKTLQDKFNAGATDEDDNEAFMLKQHVSLFFLCKRTRPPTANVFAFSPIANRHRADKGRLWTAQAAHRRRRRQARGPGCGRGAGRRCPRGRSCTGKDGARPGQGCCLEITIEDGWLQENCYEMNKKATRARNYT